MVRGLCFCGCSSGGDNCGGLKEEFVAAIEEKEESWE
jgi:hypothetical protein